MQDKYNRLIQGQFRAKVFFLDLITFFYFILFSTENLSNDAFNVYSLKQKTSELDQLYIVEVLWSLFRTFLPSQERERKIRFKWKNVLFFLLLRDKSLLTQEAI